MSGTGSFSPPAPAPARFAACYERRMSGWRDERKIRAVDDWLKANDNAARTWLCRLAREKREALPAMT